MRNNVTHTCEICGNPLKDGGVDWYCDTRGCDEELTLVNAVAAANRARLASTTAQLVEALEKARGQFAHYADLHACKGTPDGDAKAATNLALANEMAAALAAHRESQP